MSICLPIPTMEMGITRILDSAATGTTIHIDREKRQRYNNKSEEYVDVLEGAFRT